MRRLRHALTAAVLMFASGLDVASADTTACSAARYGELPLHFEPAGSAFVARGSRYRVALSDRSAALVLPSSSEGRLATVRMNLVGSRRSQGRGEERLPGATHYLLGADSRRWRTGVPQYRRVRYPSVYRGIDLVYYGRDGRVEYDFVLSPGAKPSDIRLELEGVSRMEVDPDGALVLTTPAGAVRLERPHAYQEIDGRREEVEVGYRVLGRRRVTFEVASFDPSRPLVVDPVIVYATYLGGAGDDSSSAIAVDSAGQAYVAGRTTSTSFPVGPVRGTFQGGASDAFIAKLNAEGSALVWLAYLGGSGEDVASGVAVDGSGNVVVTGWTDSANFPTASAAQPALAGGKDGFVAKLSPDGAGFVYATYLGGGADDSANGTAIDAAGSAYVAGSTSSANFPTKDPLQASLRGSSDAFVTKLNASGALLYSSYLGGSGTEAGIGVSVDSAGSAHVIGDTRSDDFPLLNGQQREASVYQKAFLSKLAPSGAAFSYSTYIGSTDSLGYRGKGIAVDSVGNAHLAVSVFATMSSIASAGPLLVDSGGQVISNYSGCAGDTNGVSGIAVDSSGCTWLTGYADYRFGGDGFDSTYVKRCCFFTPQGNLYFVYGGTSTGNAIAVDTAGAAYFTGPAHKLPTVNPFEPAPSGGSDSFVAKIDGASSAGFSILDSNDALEGSTSQFEVRLATPSSRTESVSWVTGDGAFCCNAARSGQDYVASSGTLTFDPGVVAQTVSVSVLTDASVESKEDLRVSLYGSTAPLAQPVAKGWICDASASTFLVSDATVSGGADTNAVFRIWVSPASVQGLYVTVETRDGTALAGRDYEPVAMNVFLSPGRMDHSISVPVYPHSVGEGLRTFYLDVSSYTSACVSRSSAVGTILDPPAPAKLPMYRAYNPNAHYHFFTTSRAEFDNAVAHGYRDEFTGNSTFYVPNTAQSGATALYRMYNPNSGRHYYTASAAERDSLRDVGWVYEKDEGFVFTAQTPGTVEVFRLYNNISGTHLFTEKAATKDAILAQFPGVWVQHASLGYAYDVP